MNKLNYTNYNLFWLKLICLISLYTFLSSHIPKLFKVETKFIDWKSFNFQFYCGEKKKYKSSKNQQQKIITTWKCCVSVIHWFVYIENEWIISNKSMFIWEWVVLDWVKCEFSCKSDQYKKNNCRLCGEYTKLSTKFEKKINRAKLEYIGMVFILLRKQYKHELNITSIFIRFFFWFI